MHVVTGSVAQLVEFMHDGRMGEFIINICVEGVVEVLQEGVVRGGWRPWGGCGDQGLGRACSSARKDKLYIPLSPHTVLC